MLIASKAVTVKATDHMFRVSYITYIPRLELIVVNLMLFSEKVRNCRRDTGRDRYAGMCLVS